MGNNDKVGLINSLVDEVRIPSICRVNQIFSDTAVADVAKTLHKILEPYAAKIREGDRIAITCGSRGIDQYPLLIKTVVDFVARQGGTPILVPAMGSHGGATAEGQLEVLEKFGITEEAMGAPILSSMEVVQIGVSTRGLPVFLDKHAVEADGVIVLNRIKPHTSFRGTYESGLVKMMAIGLANQRGADMTHALRFTHMADNIVASGEVVLDRLNVICGVASIENGYGKIAELHALAPGAILAEEPKLLEKAWGHMPVLCLDEIDALIVAEMGKEISGTGMDTNVIGRYHTGISGGGPRTIKLGLLDLSKGSAGNANGMGLADFVTRKLYDKIDFPVTYMNAITSTEPNSVKLPMVLDDDEAVIKACLKLCGQLDSMDARLVIIKNTKDLGTAYMSRAAVKAISDTSKVSVDDQWTPVTFDEEGNMLLFAN
ncbi:MAG TPA: lactate racemase domain-containing protein [Bacillota bacterium]|nr:lactate racemase domain-containing protein [Bacillota bacterium]